MNVFQLLAYASLLAFLIACNESGNSPSLADSNADQDLAGGSITVTDSGFSKQVMVFGVKILATDGVADDKVIHAANILAQYLDNNEDGVVDSQSLVDAMVVNSATLVMFKNEAEQNRFSGPLPSGILQNLFDEETHPEGSGPRGFDATLEEVMHLVQAAGWEQVFPNTFGPDSGSTVATYMDIARGGNFTTIPNPYPASAWYTYNDQTCDYRCQVGEYFYWVLSSILGAQDYPGRLEEIQNEWRLNTRAKVQATDHAYNLFTDPSYALPTVLPDATYAGGSFAISTL